MGNRYGGLKQLDEFGRSGETILEYSVYDAIRAGFGKMVFVIRRDIEKIFREQVGKNFEEKVAVEYVFQELDSLPEGFTVAPEREKPWGTGHAALVAYGAINEPFGVISADDFYGAGSFKTLADFFNHAADSDPAEFCLVGYRLANTLSEHGSVSRGVCSVDDNGYLTGLVECPRISKTPNGPQYKDALGKTISLPPDAIASMNYFGFTPSVFTALNDQFQDFLKKIGSDIDAEYFLPTVVDTMIQQGQARVKVLPTDETWFGVTYAEDKTQFKEKIQELTDAGRYPVSLWAD